MAERDWKQEVQENIQDFERRQNSLFHNPSLARLYIERGVAVAIVVVFTAYGSTLRGISQEGRNLFFACSIIAAMIAAALISTGVAGLLRQKQQTPAPSKNENEPPAIGW